MSLPDGVDARVERAHDVEGSSSLFNRSKEEVCSNTPELRIFISISQSNRRGGRMR